MFPGLGPNKSCWPTPQPQQCRIQNTSVTYTTAHGNAGSLTHWARPGIEPATSWFLVGFVSAVQWWELQYFLFKFIFIYVFFCLSVFTRAAPVACGDSQARGPIRATAASLHRSHSNPGSVPLLWPTPQLMVMLDPQPNERGQGWNRHLHGY